MNLSSEPNLSPRPLVWNIRGGIFFQDLALEPIFCPECKVIIGMLLRTFETSVREPIIMLFNSYLKSKLEYYYIVWPPKEQQYINNIEDIQRIFTNKIDGMKGLNYYQRLKKLGMYTMERRDRFRIIYAWQQLEKKKENIMDLKTNYSSSNRLINNGSYTKKALDCHQKCWIRSIKVPWGQQRGLLLVY